MLIAFLYGGRKMIDFTEHKLDNGLTLIVHTDKSTPLVVVNLLYKVGSRNEHPDKTGFAHLFEHLMFGGSKHVPDFDKVLHRIGAENNAFTNTDVTNYYEILSAENLETALWVESDRMMFLNLNPENLNNQKSVVVEEFKQRYLNVPYGDVWHHLRSIAYQVHPYQWPTIGKEISHIENATLDDVQDFHQKYYAPDNAVLTLAGNIETGAALDMVNKWFGDIPSYSAENGQIPMEPTQRERRFLEIEAEVPLDALYMAFHMPGHTERDYIPADLLSDLLGRGKSSMLYQALVKEKKIFNNISAYITGTADPGLLIVSGKLNPDHTPEEGEQLVMEIIDKLKHNLQDREVQKVINQAESAYYFANTELGNKALALSVANMLGDTNIVNTEIEKLKLVTKEKLEKLAGKLLVPSNCSVLYYKSSRR